MRPLGRRHAGVGVGDQGSEARARVVAGAAWSRDRGRAARGWKDRGTGPAAGDASRFRVGAGEVIGGTEDSSKPSSRLEDDAGVLLAGPGTQLEERETYSCLPPYLIGDEVLENVSPGCPSKAFPPELGRVPHPTLDPSLCTSDR